MKTDQQQQAQRLYIQTDLNKSEIAKELGVNRRTLHNWIRQNNWDRLKKSGESIPSFLAGDCYQVFGNITNHLLSQERKDKPATPQEINSMYKLILGINKLKGRPTLNENLETFGLFSEHLYSKSPDLAKSMKPFINSFLAAQAAPNHKQYKPEKLNDEGYIPTEDAATMETEAKLDEEDFLAWSLQEKENNETPPAPGGTGPIASAVSDIYPAQERSAHKGGAIPPAPVGEGRYEARRTTSPAPSEAPAEQDRNSQGEATPCAASTPFAISMATYPCPHREAPILPPAHSTDFAPRTSPLAHAKQDIRKLFRGTATKGPGKTLRQNKPIAA